MPITRSTTYRIVCDGCGHEWPSVHTDTYDEVIKYALNAGAVVAVGDEVFCVSCAPGWARGERPADAYPDPVIRELRAEVRNLRREVVEWESLCRTYMESAESATHDALLAAATCIRAEAGDLCDCTYENGEHEEWCLAVYMEGLASKVQVLEAE